MNDKKTLTLSASSKRKFFSDGRYVTRGASKDGGWASIFQATDTDTGNTVAIKVLNSNQQTDDIVEESFRREVSALADLQHPNIVKILDSGFDESSNSHFIVMEWISQNLHEYCANRKYSNWEDFFDEIGRPVLDALAFAHSHSTAHRDIKPTNILITTDGQVKICDFGIAKIRNFLMAGITLSQFASIPYAPPEIDDGSYSYSRDIFGFAVLSILLITGCTASSHDDVLNILEKSSITEPIKKILRKSLSCEEPENRPQNAVMLQAELLKAKPKNSGNNENTVTIILTNKVQSVIENDLGLSGIQIHDFLERDLMWPVGENLPISPEHTTWGMKVYGGKYRYTLVPNEDSSKLILVSALNYTSSELERFREKNLELDVVFTFKAGAIERSFLSIESLRERLLEFDNNRKITILEEKEQQLFKTWFNQLNAISELEKKKKIRVSYISLSISGELVKLVTAKNINIVSLLHQDVIIETNKLGGYSGYVVSIGDKEILVRQSEQNKVDAKDLPDKGVIETDTKKTDLAVDKQKSALDAVRYDRAVNPRLRSLIINPAQINIASVVDVPFIQKEIDDDKKAAVLAALSEPDLMIVEGPPGTGKTTFITELVLQTFLAKPHARILLTSQTHVALDNSLERIIKSSNGKINAVRIGHDSDPRISENTKNLLLDAKLPEMRKNALASGRSFIEKWAKTKDININDVQRAMVLDNYAGLKQRIESVEVELIQLSDKVSDDYRKNLDVDAREEFDELYQGLSKERSELSKALKEAFGDLKSYITNPDELKDYAESSPSDLRIWSEAFSGNNETSEKLKELLKTHADWETRFGRSREFRSAVIASSQIVAGTCLGVGSVPGKNQIEYDLCIVDEASIATPTQVLVPLTRARRAVLVGDNKQLSPFQDPELKNSGLLKNYNLTAESQKETLFRRLSEHLPLELRRPLTTQHRMLPQIGNLVSHCFYDDKLNSIPREQAAHLKGILPTPVVWYSTSKLPHHNSQKVGKTFYNETEIAQIIKILGRINFLIQKGKYKDKKTSVAILTGYGEQRERLQTSIETKRHNWGSYSEIFVNVVDAFQGREADIVIFSITRSEEATLGFLHEMERINVALSRGKEQLILVGDHYYCQTVKGAVNPLKEVLAYIRKNDLDCTLEELSE